MIIFFSSECSEKGKKKEYPIADEAILTLYHMYIFHEYLNKEQYGTEAYINE